MAKDEPRVPGVRRAEAISFLAVSLAMVAAALTWKFGAWGLLGCGLAFTAVALLVNWKE